MKYIQQSCSSIVYVQLFIFIVFFACSSSLFAAPRASSLDALSTQCLKCHEGFASGGRLCHNGDCSHPIGVDYIRLARGNASLVPPSKLDPAMKLIDGKMGCPTCHVPYNKKNHLELYKKRKKVYVKTGVDVMLAVDNNWSGLCVACHLK